MMYCAAVWIPLRVVLAVALVLLEALVVRVVMFKVFLFYLLQFESHSLQCCHYNVG